MVTGMVMVKQRVWIGRWGWRLRARIVRENLIRGYVIADTMGDEQILHSTAQVGIPHESDLPVANEVCGAGKPERRNLRNRSPIQLHPYALEREVYRRTVKVGRVEWFRIAQLGTGASMAWGSRMVARWFYGESDLDMIIFVW